MAVDTTPLYFLRDLGMAFQTRTLGDGAASICDPNVVLEVTGGEGVGMEEAIHGLSPIFGYQPGRSMTVIADRNVAMTRFHPACTLLFHHVTVCACSRIVGQIGSAPGIAKRE